MMISAIKQLIPKTWRRSWAMQLNNYKHAQLRKAILNYYNGNTQTDSSIQEALEYLKGHSLKVFPYSFQDKYEQMPCEVFHDPVCRLHYMMWQNKKLYFKRSWSKHRIASYYRSLSCEQDPRSAHRYVDNNFTIRADDVVADIGCAEANFALTYIETLKHVVLVERDAEWIEALTQTFKPYSHKVTIINKYAGKQVNDLTTTLDELHSQYRFTFLKMDLDGSEREVFEGGRLLWESNVSFRLAVCTYHQAQDAQDFKSFFEAKNFKCSFTEGYMLFIYQKNASPPYFRKGVLRAMRD